MKSFQVVDTLLFDLDGTLTDLGTRMWIPFFRAFDILFTISAVLANLCVSAIYISDRHNSMNFIKKFGIAFLSLELSIAEINMGDLLTFGCAVGFSQFVETVNTFSEAAYTGISSLFTFSENLHRFMTGGTSYVRFKNNIAAIRTCPVLTYKHFSFFPLNLQHKFTTVFK